MTVNSWQESVIEVGRIPEVVQSDNLLTGGASQSRNMRNKGAEINFYNLRNWVTKGQ